MSFRDSLARSWPKSLWLLLDLASMAVASAVSVAVLGERPAAAAASEIVAIALLRIALFVRTGMYHAVLRYSGVHALVTLTSCMVVAAAVGAAADWALHDHPLRGLGLRYSLLEFLLVLASCGGSRLAVRLVHEYRTASRHRRRAPRVLVFGAGALGEMVLRSLRRTAAFHPVALLDDDPRRRGSVIHGRTVAGALDDLPHVARRTGAELLLVAIRDLPPERLKHVFSLAMACGLRVKAVSGVEEMISGVGEARLDDVALEDLLRRPQRDLDPAVLPSLLSGKTVLVTGAGGSIGSELCRQIACNNPRRIVLVDHSEHSLYTVEMWLRDNHPGIEIDAQLLNLAYQAPLERLFARTRPDIVFHAAAYKHVPMVEANPILGVRNNVGCFLNLLEAATAARVPRVVLVSTDKAVRPTNVMGATKRVCEVLLQNWPDAGVTRMCAVRFGNVLGSSGSVVPRFLEQIANGGPVTVTHRDMTRYFMLIPEAATLVLHAAALADHGEIFILDMGEPVKIADMARQLIYMTGHVPDREIAIEYTGLRPGEKLFEELLLDESERATPVPGITVARPSRVAWPALRSRIDDLLLACETQDVASLARALQQLVPEWTPSPAMSRHLATAPTNGSGAVAAIGPGTAIA